MHALRAAAVLAWRMMIHDRRRLAFSIGGAAFAVLIILVQLRVRDALFDSAVALIGRFDGEVVILSAARESLGQEDLRVPVTRLAQAMAVPGVEWTGGLILEKQLWKKPDGTEGPMRVIALEPVERPALHMPSLEALRTPGTALYDVESRSHFGFRGLGPGEVNGRRVDIVGTVHIGTDFAVDANLVVSFATFQRLTRRRSIDEVDVGLVRVKPGADPERVAAEVRAILPADVLVLTTDGFRAHEVAYWGRRTPIGPAFAIGAVMGFMVGVAIVFQILFTEVSDHLKQLAALKAIGYRSSDLRAMVLFEALFLSLAAFAVATLVGGALLASLAAITGLPLALSVEGSASLLAATVAMGIVPALIAVRKVTQADPAELFE